MPERLNYWVDQVFNFTLLILAVAVPFFFWNITTEFYETPKFLILLATTVLLILLWSVKFVLLGKTAITRTPLDLAMLLLLAVFIISTIFASSKPVAILGNLPRLHGGLASYAVYIAFFFVLASNLKQTSTVKKLVYLFLASGVVLSVLSLFSYAGKGLLPLPWTSQAGFTPTGSNFSTTAFLSLMLPFPLIAILRGTEKELLTSTLGKATGKLALDKVLAKSLACALLILLLVTITLTGTLATYVAGAAVFVLALLVNSQTSIKNNLPYIATPVVASLIIAFFSFAPVGGSSNLLYQKAQNFPREIQLPVQTSWKVSISAFRDAPFWGTGPGSYLFDFTSYKPVEFNSFKFWTVRFDSAFNEYLSFLATLGSLGLISLLLLTAVFISIAFKAFSSPRGSLGVSLAISGIIFFILLALHASTLLLWVTGIFILVSFMAIHRDKTDPAHTGQASGNTLRVGQIHVDALPAIIFLTVFGLSVFTLYQAGKTTLADYHHRSALTAVSSGRALDAYNELIKAERLNPHADIYRTDLAQTNFALANAIATAKGPTESSPAGSLSDEDKQNIRILLSQAIDEGKAGVALSPRNAANWEVLGSIYRQISGVAQNALSFSLDSYGRAIQQDPLNPLLRLTVGGVYYSVKNYDLAIRFFTDTVNLKPDYANGYYNLAVALREKGDLPTAQAVMEKTISLLDPKGQDYKVASDFLADLKARAASESGKQTANSQETPLQESPSALQSKKLPKVLDLPKPENVTTPSAVKKQAEE